MVIVSDTSPITSLIQVNRLDLIRQVLGKVIIPETVYDELCKVPNQQSILDAQPWIFVQKANNRQKVAELEKDLDAGESEAIVLALEVNADFLVIDEWKGRERAEELGLKIIGLLGLLLRAKKEGFVTSVKLEMDELIEKAEFRINPLLYKQILKMADE